jgi:transcriptional regulator with XRE-family HTH domain
MKGYMYNPMMPTFAEYLLSKLQEFEKQRGKRTSLDKFAEYIGVSRPLVSYWLKGTIPGLENVQILANKFGPEVYDVLGLPRPNPFLQKINQVFDSLSAEHQRKLAELAERYEVNNNEENAKRSSKERKTSPR